MARKKHSSPADRSPDVGLSHGTHYNELLRKLRQARAAMQASSGACFLELEPTAQDDYLGMVGDLVQSALERATAVKPQRDRIADATEAAMRG
jgi:hypothetical protein